jgi:hypothetical protein
LCVSIGVIRNLVKVHITDWLLGCIYHKPSLRLGIALVLLDLWFIIHFWQESFVVEGAFTPFSLLSGHVVDNCIFKCRFELVNLYSAEVVALLEDGVFQRSSCSCSIGSSGWSRVTSVSEVVSFKVS